VSIVPIARESSGTNDSESFFRRVPVVKDTSTDLVPGNLASITNSILFYLSVLDFSHQFPSIGVKKIYETHKM
jgi:hypothetical protein